jgi:pilus assembly protein CpaD
MSRSITLFGLVAILGGCQTTAPSDRPGKGVASVNVPVVTRADYALDLAAPDGTLSPSETARLNSWFGSMVLGYGDLVYIDGATGYDARDDVARIAGQYGMLLSQGAPMTAGAVPQGMVRVVVARTSATVPGCPNWTKASTPTFDNASMSNFGCGINSNMAAMVARPDDLVSGREGSASSDASTGAKAILMYRNWPLTAVVPGQALRPLKVESTVTKGK